MFQTNSFYGDRQSLIYARAERQDCLSKSVVWGPSHTFPQKLSSGVTRPARAGSSSDSVRVAALPSDVPGPLDGVATASSMRKWVLTLRTRQGSPPLSRQGRSEEGFQERGWGSETRPVTTALGASRKPLKFWQDL